MSEDPCKRLHDEYVQAMNEWMAAAAASQSWAATTPLSLTEDISPLTLAQTQKMGEDFAREEAARKKYVSKSEAYFDCRKQHRPSR